MRLRDVQRGQQPEYVLIARRTDKNMLVVDQFLAQRSRILEQFDTDHQAPAAHLFNIGKLAQLGDQVVAHLFRIVDQILLLDYVGHGNGCGTGQVVAAEGGPEHAIFRRDARRDRNGSHRETVADPLGHRIDVGRHSGQSCE